MSFQSRPRKGADEVVDVVLSFVSRLAKLGVPADTISSYVTDCDSGIVIESDALEAGNQAVRMFVSGGVSGRSYTAFAEAVTVGGRTLRVDVQFKIRGGLPAVGITIDGGTGDDGGDGLDVDGGTGA